MVSVSVMIFAPDSWGLPHIQGTPKTLMEEYLHAMSRSDGSLKDPHPEKAEKGRTGIWELKELLSFYNDQGRLTRKGKWESHTHNDHDDPGVLPAYSLPQNTQ